MGIEFYLPQLFLIAIGWCLCAFALVSSDTAGSRSERLRALVRSPLFPSAAFVIGAGVALMTSRNGGFGFKIPLLAPAAIVASAGWSRAVAGWSSARTPRRVFLVATCAGLGVFAVPSFGGTSTLRPGFSINVEGATLIVARGVGADPAYFGSSTSDVTNRASWDGRWRSAIDMITRDVRDGTTERPDFAFGFRGKFVNVNSVQLDVVRRVRYGVGIAQVDPTKMPDTVRSYRSWLTTGAAGGGCHLMTSPGTVNELTPVVTTQRMEAAAVGAGFAVADLIPLPNGRIVSVWERDGRGC